MSLWHFPLLLTSSFSFTWQDCVICVAVPPPPFFSSSMLAALIVTDTITKGRQMWPMRSAIGYKVVTYMIWKVLILILGLLLNWKKYVSTGEVSEPVAHILFISVSTLCPSIGLDQIPSLTRRTVSCSSKRVYCFLLHLLFLVPFWLHSL